VTDLSRLLDVFDPDTVHRLATDREIRRGESYLNGGAVEITALTTTAVAAHVQGTHRYEVRFDVSEHPEWSCTCPAAVDGDFCKHCVAVALELAMIDAGTVDPPLVLPADAQPPRSQPRRMDGDNHDVGAERRRIIGYLEQLPTEQLIGLIVEQTDRDWKLRERLLLDAGDEGVDLDRWIRRIDEATYADDYVDWRGADSWSNGVNFVLDAIDDLLACGHADAVIPLTEHAFRAVERTVGYVDDSESGCLRNLSERIGELHLQACEVRPPDPIALARTLVDLELHSELEGLYHAVETYADLLGDRGMAEYGRLLDALGTGSSRSDREYTLKSMRRAYVAALDDVDALVVELARDPGPGDIVSIMEALAGAGRIEDAIDAGREGMSRLSGSQYHVSGLIDALAALLRTRGHDDEAIGLYRGAFESAPSLGSLQRYLDSVGDDRDGCLNAAIDHVRGQVETAPAGRPRVSNEVFVEILMWAGRDDDAWEAATAGGCSPRRWIDLAKRRESSHPIDAIDIYEPLIFRSIEAKNNHAYAAAVDLMGRVERLTEAAGVQERFETIVEVARTTHKAKRNLQKLLNERGW
jgi:tetratricopeptide (TPR) repeat protein